MTDFGYSNQGVDPTVLERDGATFAHQAVQYDKDGQYNMAVFYYSEAAQALLSAALAGSQMPGIIEKANEYLLRAEELNKSVSSKMQSTNLEPHKTEQQKDLERAKFLISNALEADEGGNAQEAIELYSEAVELWIKIKQSTSDKILQDKVTKLASQALDRAEKLKSAVDGPKLPSPPSSPKKRDSRRMPPLGYGAFLDDEEQKGAVSRVSRPQQQRVSTGPISVGPDGYTKEEIDVLRRTSIINGREYVPFLEVDRKEKFAFPVTFSDKDGKLALSPKQKERFGKWDRPESFCDNPQMIYAISSFSIRQTVVSDCSFVASLAISAQYERRFNKKLITSIIYPQNKQGEPVYNPCGKYVVKLNLNGVPRKVIIDDFLPLSQGGELLCSFSNNKSELWVSLLEKAYMKVMGGYDFPGSNSGKKLFMLKNPWNHLRWKGRFSEKDMESWTPEMQKALNYDPKSAQMVDNGVFWIDYDSLIHFFDVIYINWNPELFKYTSCIHQSWHAKEGPKKDRYNISDNPQYRLELKSSQPSAVWILLTRHITDKDDFADNREFIAVLVYNTDGKKVFYPYDPPPYKDGVRINSPHYLCKLVENKGNAAYTLVMSQYEKNNTIHYTLRVYATCEFSLTKIADPYNKKNEKRITGQWKGKTAGGCANFPETHRFNPIYQIKIDNTSTENYVLVELLGPKEYSVGVEAITVSETVPNAPGSFSKKPSGDFRRGYCVLQLDRISGGVYNLTPCTFQAGQEGHFFLDISSSAPFTISQLQ
ncbi:hypothetical protein CHS0354_014448 [Potamilus streckersoni]|uniref:Calpain catalytic domain-containing protein n=1 Tax=Potamilus streckersoni TaxID=2493646 RepID=A0AAE0SAB8_9BIVA|nr:hypothetical protein CHS0354_014448 [Potamilus streckersoni]